MTQSCHPRTEFPWDLVESSIRLGLHQMLGKSSTGQETGNLTEMGKSLGGILLVGCLYHGEGGIPATFATESIRMQMGAHSEVMSFIIAPGMERLLVLGLVWLKKWNPYVNWRKGLLKFQINCSS